MRLCDINLAWWIIPGSGPLLFLPGEKQQRRHHSLAGLGVGGTNVGLGAHRTVQIVTSICLVILLLSRHSPFYHKMGHEFCYTSQDPKIGGPSSLSWEHFARPKLGRFPQASFTFMEYLGHGAEGIAVKVKADGYPEPIVFKIVSPDSPYCRIFITCDHDNRCTNVVLIMNSSY